MKGAQAEQFHTILSTVAMAALASGAAKQHLPEQGQAEEAAWEWFNRQEQRFARLRSYVVHRKGCQKLATYEVRQGLEYLTRPYGERPCSCGLDEVLCDETR